MQLLVKSTFGDRLQLAGALRVGAVQRLGLAEALQRQEGVVVWVQQVRQLQRVILGTVEGQGSIHTTVQNLRGTKNVQVELDTNRSIRYRYRYQG